MARFVLQLSFKNEARRLEVRPAHRDYLRRLLDEGRLVTAGPFADDKGALLVYEVADEAELREVLAADPYTAADVYDIEQLREWSPILP
ncbi:MAG TPA: YciI family protein [Streptosporangiaceae bacterium]